MLDAASRGETGSPVLAGAGEMGALMRSIDWSQSAVGPVERWPQSLRTALSILLETGFPMYIAWGRDFTQFYNDGYRPILGSAKHPRAMGISTRETFVTETTQRVLGERRLKATQALENARAKRASRNISSSRSTSSNSAFGSSAAAPRRERIAAASWRFTERSTAPLPCL
jgi:hypothetical protein